ncbi:NmrA family NAD(P)-binding protein, partial [Parafrankia sp. Ea1.12]|uniref:NmrA family NAD(P)-binding protein n=1 Tax=Parafrankia sp. Ea1.12 TaxID=573499 RepID=UPI001F32A7D7
MADAAAAARVPHLVYASVAGVERGGGGRAFASKRAIEEHIRRIDIPATILRPASFMENYADPAFGVQTGTLATPFAPDIPEQLIALDDIGAFVALAFTDPVRYLGRADSSPRSPPRAARRRCCRRRGAPASHCRPRRGLRGCLRGC